MAVFINGQSLKSISDILEKNEKDVTTLKDTTKQQEILVEGTMNRQIGVESNEGRDFDRVGSASDIEKVIISH